MITLKLIIAEKPSVARDIADVIGVVKRHNGYIEAKGYTVTWAIGHLVTLADAHDYDAKYKKWRLDDLPIVPKPFRLKVIDATREQYKIVTGLLKRAKEVIVATDAGREGQLIYELTALSVGYKGPTKRLWLSSMTGEAIRQAMVRLRNNEDYKNLYYAGFARAQADWLTGINATRAITTHVGSLLTIGRVQTPTLAMIVKRDMEIEQFIPEDYFELEATFVHEQGKYTGKWFNGKKSRFQNIEDAEAMRARVTGQKAHIARLEQKTMREQPPLLFDLTSLQRIANQKYHFTAEQTLKLAQSLYETHKVLTYPRTDSRYLSKDVTSTLRQRLLASTKTFPELASFIPETIRPTSRVVNDAKVTDHHAIIPTEKVAGHLGNDERKIYQLVVKQTIAALLPAAEWASTVIETAIGSETFRSTGRSLTTSGWRAVLGANHLDAPTKSKNQTEEQTLPAVATGDNVKAASLDVLSKQTKPPAHFTEATLLAAMEHAGKQVDDEMLAQALKGRGLGTPATRASMIEKIKRDGYVEVQNRNLISTDKGRALIEAVQVDVLKSAELTGEWEHKLAQIESGTYPVSQFIEEITEFTRLVVATIQNTEVHTSLQSQSVTESVGRCPLCGGDVVETKKSFSCVNWKTKECSFAVWKQLSGHRMTKAQVKELLTKKKTKLLKFKSKTGKPFNAHLSLTDGKVEFEFVQNARNKDKSRKGGRARQ